MGNDEQKIDYRIWRWPIFTYRFFFLLFFLIALIWICDDFAEKNLSVAGKFDFNKRNQVIEMVQQGKLKPGQNGRIVLPVGFEKLAVFGCAWEKKGSGRLRVDFPLLKKKDDFDAFVYYQGEEMPEVKNRYGKIIPVHKIRDHWFYADSMEIYAEKN